MEIARMVVAGLIIGIEAVFLYLILSGNKKYLPFIKAHSSLPTANRPYSFSRVQLLWWTLIIVSCVALIFAQKSDVNFSSVFNETSLILLGISLGTVTTARIIDNSDVNNSTINRHQDNRTSKGFILDILSDSNGVSLHRFQAVIFNVLFGMVFLVNFFTDGMISLQSFGTTELGLMGISSGGYLALKISENQSYQPSQDVDAVQNTTAVNTQGTYTPPPGSQVNLPANTTYPSQPVYTPPTTTPPQSTYTPPQTTYPSQPTYTPPQTTYPSQPTYTPPQTTYPSQPTYTPPVTTPTESTYTPPVTTTTPQAVAPATTIPPVVTTTPQPIPPASTTPPPVTTTTPQAVAPVTTTPPASTTTPPVTTTTSPSTTTPPASKS